MSRVTTYTCDHCGAKVSPFIGEQWAANVSTVGPNMPDVHGCSKEHLGLALAKAFGVPADGAATDAIREMKATIARKDVQLEENINARNAAEVRVAQLAARIDELKKRIAEQSTRESELHATLAAHGLPTEPKALARELAQRSAPTPPDTRSGLERLDTAAVLRKVRERLLDRSTEIPFGDGSKRRFVALQAVFDTIDELSELEANITDPQKPTKPAIPLCVCKRTPDRHIQTVKGDGWLDCDGLVRLYQ